MTLADLLDSLEAYSVQLLARGEHSLVLAGAVNELPPDLIDEVNRHKMAILELLSTPGTPTSSESPPGMEGTVYLASHGQSRLAFLDRLEPHSTAYNVSASILISGPCRSEDLAATITQVTATHPASRTRLARVNDVNLSVVTCHAPLIELPVIDLSLLPPSNREQALERVREEVAQTHFDLERLPLYNLRLVRLSPERHELVAALHHYICDGWSLVRALREVAALYTGHLSTVRRLPVKGAGSYAEYARQQRATCRTPAVEHSLVRWRERLQAFQNPIQFPPSVAQASPDRGSGARLTFTLNAELEHRLRSLANSLRCTLATALTGIFALTLARMSRSGKFLIGMAASDRPHSDFEETVGFFVNWLPLRVDLSNNPDFATFLADLHLERMTAFADVHIPFDEIVRAAGHERKAERHPLFQFMFVSHVPARGVRFGDLKAQVNPLFSGASKLDLTMFFTDARRALSVVGSGQVHLEIEYAAGLFDKSTIERFIHNFLDIAQHSTLNPSGKPVWLKPQASTTRPAFSHSISPLIDIANAIANNPDLPAVSFHGQTWTYRQLAAFASLVAHDLAKNGLHPGDRVCVLCARGPALVGAMLAAMLSGGIFTPLDAGNPDSRLKLIVDQAAPSIFLASDDLVDRARLLAGEHRVMNLSQIHPNNASASWDHWLTGIQRGSPAYLLFTSGSTGRPKGVLGGHFQLANFCSWLSRYLELGTGDKVLGKTSFAFDASFRETITPLTVGASIELAGDCEALDSMALLRIIATHGVTVLHATPTLYRDLLLVLEQAQREGLAGQAPTGLRSVMCGGETMDRELSTEHFRLLPTCRLYNLYGPTECTVDVTAYEVSAQDSGVLLPVGQPIQNTSIIIVDPERRPVGAGEEGEIVILGHGVGPGYWGDAKPRDKNMPDGFIPARELGLDIAGDAFLSGDYGVLREDGVIEFRGRKDRQIQLGGVRIELDEVEAALLRIDSVGQAALSYRRDRPPGHIVAFVELKAGRPSPDIAGWRETLSQYLPAVMIPSSFEVLDRLPRLVTGKIDRDALAQIATADTEEGELGMEAKVIVSLMCELLGRRDVSPHISFFAQGGHSLNAVRLVARANHKFSRSLTIKDFFTDPTAIGFARRITSTPDVGARELPMVRTPRPRRTLDG